jgi:3'-5' exoribonuclease
MIKKESVEKLNEVILSLDSPFKELCQRIAKYYPEFFKQIGGIRHHDYYEGLIDHTLEVIYYCESLCNLKYNTQISRNVLLTAAIWHDLGKIWEYEWKDEEGKWGKTTKGEQLHHIFTSIAEFTCHAKEVGLKSNRIDQINHIIASHHYYIPERPYPILPQTLEAMILCSADHLSAMFGETK